MTSKGIIVKNIYGERYLLTSRRAVELDNTNPNEEPWYSTNKDIRTAVETDAHTINIRFKSKSGLVLSVLVPFGKDYGDGSFRIGCGRFDFKTFKKILRNAGVQGTQKKSFATRMGA